MIITDFIFKLIFNIFFQFLFEQNLDLVFFLIDLRNLSSLTKKCQIKRTFIGYFILKSCSFWFKFKSELFFVGSFIILQEINKKMFQILNFEKHLSSWMKNEEKGMLLSLFERRLHFYNLEFLFIDFIISVSKNWKMENIMSFKLIKILNRKIL